MKKITLLLLVTLVTGTCVYAQNQTMQIYKNDVIVESIVVSQIDSIKFADVSSTGSSENEIVHFYLDLYKDAQSSYDWRGDVQMADPDEVTIDQETRTITYTLPLLPDWFTPEKMTVFPAVIQISEGATVSPNWNVPQDFTKDVVYTVTAENGDKKVWTVKAPKYYTKAKWNVDYASLRDNVTDMGAQNPNSVALIGNYVSLGRTADLLNKSDGTLADTKLNVTGWRALNNSTSTDPVVTQDFPFFITNDDAGNMVGINLGAWNADVCAVYKWTSPTDNPVEVMAFPTKQDGTQFGSFGRKLQVLGNLNENGLIISPNTLNIANGEHYIWKINGGEVDKENPVVEQSKIAMNGSAYQVLTPLGLEPAGPYYVSTPLVGESYPNLQFGEPGNMEEIKGPFASVLETASANGWGNQGFHYLKLFTLDEKNMIATLSNSYGYYCFAIQERATNSTLVPFATDILEWNSENWVNGNNTGSFTMEKVGNDIFFYVFTTNRAIVCYQVSKF